MRSTFALRVFLEDRAVTQGGSSFGGLAAANMTTGYGARGGRWSAAASLTE